MASTVTRERRRPAPLPPRDRIRAEFTEMHGFSPTLDQAARLFDLSRDECDRLLRSMVKDGSLQQCDDGRYRLPQFVNCDL